MSLYFSKFVPSIKCRQTQLLRFSNYIDTKYNRDEKGSQKKIIHGQEYPSWKIPVSETPGEFQTKFRYFQSDKLQNPVFLRLGQYPVENWPSGIKQWFLRKHEETIVSFQAYNAERVNALGTNLAVAHFIIYRGGAIKFLQGEWIKIEKKQKKALIPNTFYPGIFVEEIDCENFQYGGLRYEGLLNFEGLDFLKWLSLKGNSHIDDWCLDRLSRLTCSSLEYLDLQGCSVTYRGIQVLHRMEKLKLLILDLEETELLEYTVAALQELNPELLVKYNTKEPPLVA